MPIAVQICLEHVVLDVVFDFLGTAFALVVLEHVLKHQLHFSLLHDPIVICVIASENFIDVLLYFILIHAKVSLLGPALELHAVGPLLHVAVVVKVT